jgi:hypothetical protein
MRTYAVCMNITVSVDEQIAERARERATVMGKSLDQVLQDYLHQLAGDDGLKRDLEYLERYSGLGDSQGWKFNREEIYERK